MKYKNNPLNIRYNLTPWLGLTGVNHGFCEFDELQHGLRAGLRIMETYRNKYGACTVYSILHRFAPPTENNTEEYMRFVCQKANLTMHNRLCSDLEYCRLLHAMCLYESSSVVSVAYIQSVMSLYRIKIVS